MAAITAELALEVSKFQDALKKAQQSVNGFKTHAEKSGGGLGMKLFGSMGAGLMAIGTAAAGLIASVGGIAGAAAGLKNAFDLGAELKDSAAQIGSTAGQTLLLQQAFKNAGMEAEEVTKVIDKMQKNVAAGTKRGSEQEAIFTQLGINPTQLANMDPSTAFQKVGTAIASIRNPTQRVAAAMAVFGRTGAKALAMFSDGGGLNEARAMLGSQVDILDKSAEDFHQASIILGSAFRKLQGFFVGVGSRIVTSLQPFLEQFNKIDLAGIGQRFGDAMVRAFQIIKATIQELTAGDLFSLVGDSLAVGFKEAINVLWAGFWGFVRALGQFVQEFGKSLVTLVSIVTTSEFWAGMGHALMGIALAFDAAMMEVIAKVLTEVKKIPIVGKVVGDADKKAHEQARALDEAGKKERAQAGAQLAPAIAKAAERFAEAAHNIGDAFERGYKGADKVFDPSEERARIADAIKRINERAKKNQAEDEKNKKPEPPKQPIAPLTASNAVLPARWPRRSISSWAAAPMNCCSMRAASKPHRSNKSIRASTSWWTSKRPLHQQHLR